MAAKPDWLIIRPFKPRQLSLSLSCLQPRAVGGSWGGGACCPGITTAINTGNTQRTLLRHETQHAHRPTSTDLAHAWSTTTTCTLAAHLSARRYAHCSSTSSLAPGPQRGSRGLQAPPHAAPCQGAIGAPLGAGTCEPALAAPPAWIRPVVARGCLRALRQAQQQQQLRPPSRHSCPAESTRPPWGRNPSMPSGTTHRSSRGKRRSTSSRRKKRSAEWRGAPPWGR